VLWDSKIQRGFAVESCVFVAAPQSFKRDLSTSQTLSDISMFKLAPQEIPDGFVWNHKFEHLTYRSFISKDKILNMVQHATSIPLDGWSICHEDTTETGPDGVTRVGYQHTHVAFMFKSRLNVKGARAFDIWVFDDNGLVVDIIHPHVQPKVTITAMECIFTQYHAGRKYDITTGSYKYKKPIYHEYKLPAMYDFTRVTLEEMCNAPSLFEACMVGQIKPRTVNDVKALRDDTAASAAKRFKHMFEPDTFKALAPPDWTVLHAYGGSGLGKTKWAVAQFKNPCFVKPFDSIGCLENLSKLYDPSIHDGLVCDEADLRFMSRQQAIAFLDMDEPCTLDVRYKSFTLPAGVKKILISNPHPKGLYPPDPHGAIARRFTTLHIATRTWLSSENDDPNGNTFSPLSVDTPWRPM
jgi:hypothetical protein